MAVTKSIVYLFAVLVPLALVYSQNPPPLPIPGFPGGHGLPNIPQIPGLPGNHGSSTGAPGDQDGDQDHQDRLFFSLFSRVTSCNYTSEPGLTCRSCTQALNCRPSNFGIIRTCRGLFRYCNNGRCSLYQGSACTSTTSTTTTTTTTTTTAAPTGK